MQDKKLTIDWLYSRGWTVRQAADTLECNPGHLSRILRGSRQSKAMEKRLRSLPKQTLTPRRKLATA